MSVDDKYFMKQAVREARAAHEAGDYGIGSVIVQENCIIARGRETLKSICDPTGHAEINAIREACRTLNTHYLHSAIIYSTHEPCPMCASAIYWAKMSAVVFGVSREDMISKMRRDGSKEFSWRQIAVGCSELLDKTLPNLGIEVRSGVLRDECLKLLEMRRTPTSIPGTGCDG